MPRCLNLLSLKCTSSPGSGQGGIELCLLEAFADAVGGGQDADVDDDGVIVPSRRWSGRGLSEAGVVCLESVI